MKNYRQARFDKFRSIVDQIRKAEPYERSSIAKRLGMSELELCCFASGSNVPLLTDLIEIENKMNNPKQGGEK